MEQYFRVGVLTSAHGLKGEIKVFPTTEDIRRFELLKKVFIDRSSGKSAIKGEGLLEAEAERIKYFKNLVIVKFKGIDTVEEISKYKGMDLLIDREDALPLKEGEYYVSDVIGCRIVTEDGEELGKVSDVIETGANKVLVVREMTPSGDGKEFCLPYIPDCVRTVNVEERMIKVVLMPGLLD